MGGITIIIGAGLIAFLLLYLFTHLDKDQFLFKLLILFFVFGLMIIIGQSSVNEQDYCSWNVINSTTTGSTTTYGMDYVCSENTDVTGVAFYKTVLWFVRITVILLFFYLLFYKQFVLLTQKILGGGGDND